MSIENFIPKIWSARLLVNLNDRLVYGGLCNNNYQGDIQQRGDTVQINGIGAVSVQSYTKNTDLASPENLQDASTTLVIDQSPSFNFQVDDVDRVQGNPQVMNTAMEQSAYALRANVDETVAAAMVADGQDHDGSASSAYNFAGTSAKNAYDTIVDLGVALDDANTPEAGRWIVVPNWFAGLLHKDDRVVGSGSEAADTRLMRGYVTTINNTEIYKSNKVPTSGSGVSQTWKIVAGHSLAVTLAQQFQQVETGRMEKRFADYVRGLLLYGVKVTHPNNIVVLTAKKDPS
jgi:hypothetical protein